MSLRVIVYEKKDTKKWVAEINKFETPVDSHITVVKERVWRNVFDSKEKAQEAAQTELEKKMGILI